MTRYDPERDRRRSIRLRGYDYAQPGAYFVTICTQERLCLFGEIVDGKVILNDAGRIATKCWNDIPVHFPQVALDQFVVMPNHVHGILWIVKTIGAKDVSPDDGKHISPVGAKNLSPLRSQPAGTSKTIGSIVRGFKIGVTQWMRQERNVRDVWQRNYYEHIIRNETALNRIRQYIVENPARWAEDLENPKCVMPIHRRERRGEKYFAPETGADERGRGERFFAPTMGTARKSAPTGNDPPSQRRPQTSSLKPHKPTE